MLKKIVSILVLLGVLLSSVPAWAAEAKSIEFTKPIGDSYLVGETITVQVVTHGFTPSVRYPLSVYLVQKATNRRILLRRSSNTRTLAYKIPFNLFERLRSDKNHFNLLARYESKEGIVTAESKQLTITTRKKTPAFPSTPVVPQAPQPPTITPVPIVILPSSTTLEPEGVLTSGADRLVAIYRFSAMFEGYLIQKLTVINDSNSNLNNAEDTNIVSKVTLVYPDQNGQKQVVSSVLSSGLATFNLSEKPFFIDRNKTESLAIYANTTDISSGTFTLSGKKFRIGLLQTNDQSTFQAIGATSGESTFNLASFGATSTIKEYTARKSKPIFKMLSPVSNPAQMASTNNLYQFSVTAQGGDVTLARLVFDVNTTGFDAASKNLSNFKFRRGTSLSNVSDVTGVNIFGTNDAGNNVQNLKTGSLDPADGAAGNGVANGTYKVIVTFDNPEIIEKDHALTYMLVANQTGAVTNDTVSTRISAGDETSPVTALTVNNGNQNTGQIYRALGGTLFTPFASDFSQSLSGSRNVIWSDQSGGQPGPISGAHSYPTVTGGVATDNTGTVDFTNGYGLQLNSLDAITYKQ